MPVWVLRVDISQCILLPTLVSLTPLSIWDGAQHPYRLSSCRPTRVRSVLHLACSLLVVLRVILFDFRNNLCISRATPWAYLRYHPKTDLPRASNNSDVSSSNCYWH